MKNNNKGFGAIELLIILIIVIAVVGAGWFVMMRNDSSKTTIQSSQTKSDDQPITNKDELTSVSSDLEKLDIDGQLNTNDLDQALAE